MLPDVIFDVEPRQNVIDKTLHSILRPMMDLPNKPLFSPMTINETLLYLRKEAREKGVRVRAERMDWSIRGEVRPHDFERLFGVQLGYQRFEIKYKNGATDDVEYYFMIDEPDCTALTIAAVTLDPIYDKLMRGVEENRNDGSKVREIANQLL